MQEPPHQTRPGAASPVRGLSSRKPAKVDKAMRLLLSQWGRSSGRRLLEVVRDETGPVELDHVVSSLRRIGDPYAVAALTDLAAHAGRGRGHAQHVLREVLIHADDVMVEAFLHHDHPRIRLYDGLLPHPRARIVDVATGMLQHRPPLADPRRVVALRALARHAARADEWRPLALSHLADASPTVVAAAVEHLDGGRPDDMAQLMSLVRDHRPAVAHAAVRRLSTGPGEPRAVAALVAAGQRHGIEPIQDALAAGEAGHQALAQLRQDTGPVAVPLHCAACGIEVLRYTVTPPPPVVGAAGQPATTTGWMWTPPGGAPRATGEHLHALLRGQPNAVLPLHLTRSEADLEPVVAAVCPVCQLVWCPAHRDTTSVGRMGTIREYGEIVGMTHDRHCTVRHPCRHERRYSVEDR